MWESRVVRVLVLLQGVDAVDGRGVMVERLAVEQGKSGQQCLWCSVRVRLACGG